MHSSFLQYGANALFGKEISVVLQMILNGIMLTFYCWWHFFHLYASEIRVLLFAGIFAPYGVMVSIPHRNTASTTIN